MCFFCCGAFCCGALAQELEATEASFQTRRSAAQANLDHRQFPAALQGFQDALLIAKRLANSTDAAIAYRGIGLVYRGMSQTTLALSSYELGYQAAVEAGDKTLMAVLLRGSGVAKRNLGRIDEAIVDDKHSVALYRELNDQRETAAGLANLAVNYLRTGDLSSAAEILEQARQIGQPWPEIVDPILNNLGRTAASQGNLPAAMDYLEHSLQSSGQRHATGTMLVALANLGIVYRAMGQMEKAEAALNQTLAISREIHDSNIESITLVNRANIYENTKRKDLAIADLKKSLEVLKRIDTPLVVAHTLVALMRLDGTCPETGKPPELERALAIGRQFQAHDILWPALHLFGECALTRNDFVGARDAFAESVAEVELLRDLAGGDDQTAKPFLADKTQPYHSLLNVALLQHQPEFAFETAERAKARQLLDTVRRGGASPRTSVSANEQAEENRLNDALTILDRRLAEAPAGDQRRHAEWTKAQMELASYREHLYSTHPDLAGRRGEAAPAPLTEMAALLPDRQTILVEFTVADDALYIFSITRGPNERPALTTRKIAWKKTDLAREVSRFREQLATRSPAYRSAGEALYMKLLGPIAQDLRGKETLVLVPDGPLWDLPFQALVRPDGAHLIERTTVFYAPSLTYMREIRRGREAVRAPKRLLAFGNPGTVGLPNTAREVRGLATLYGPAGTRILNGPDATKQEWLRSASEYQVLHLATHGVLNSANPMHSWLSLASETGEGMGDALEAREVIAMHLRADVAVLSACDTARGESSPGEGMVGMSWAFLMAGASTTVVSQWSVDSASTTQLMLAFHGDLLKALDAGEGRARALRSGALAVMRSPEHRHPYYWAGFIMVGDGY